VANRTLVLMRHAKSSWETNEDDIHRPLSSRGKRDAEAAGRYLQELGLSFDVVLLSPAARVRETWAGLTAAGVTASSERVVDDIYHRDADAIVAAIREAGGHASTVLVLGHSPTIPETVELVAERATTKDWFALDTKYPTSGIAVIELDSEWDNVGDASGRLIAFTVPRG